MRVPKYRHQKSSGRALVEINGRRIYLGPYGSAESRRRYQKILASLDAPKDDADTPPQTPAQAAQDGVVLVKDVIWRYWSAHVQTYYVKHGQPTSEQSAIHSALKPLRRLFGEIDAGTFDHLMLESYRDELIELGMRVTTINQHVGRVKRAFRWAAKKGLVPASTFGQLQLLEGLRRGRTKAKPPKDVQPVPDDVIQETLPHLSNVVAAMVRFQRLTGCRPGEACMIRPCDVERPPAAAPTGDGDGGGDDSPSVLPLRPPIGGAKPASRPAGDDVWCYQPATHKTEHHGRERRIFIGPRAQAVLRPWLDRDPESYCFSPKEAVLPKASDSGPKPFAPLEREAETARATGRRRSCYDKDSYRTAVAYGLVRWARSKGHTLPVDAKGKAKRPTIAWFASAGIPYWTPNQLRHTAGTELRKRYGLDAASTVLGHEDADVTQVYAERDFQKARDIMRELG